MDLYASTERARELTRSAHPSVVVDYRQLPLLELLLSGALSPLSGFMGAVACEACAKEMRLPDGSFWPRPIVFELEDVAAEALQPGQIVILRAPEGDALGALHLDERWRPADRTDQAIWRLAGRVEGLSRPRHYDFLALRRTPTQTRAEFARRRWTRVLACSLDRSPSSADVAALERLAQEVGASVQLQVAVDTSDPSDERPYQVVRSLQSAVAGRDERVLLTAWSWSREWPLPSSTTDPSWGALGAIIARNHGCTHVVLTPEAFAGLGVRGFGADDLGIRPVQSRVVVDAAPQPPVVGTGTTIFFTGLSGSGKSTIANAVRVLLMERGIRVTFLDGDVVRRHLSSDLGFSREHREKNVLRIGYVASEITKHGGIAICAPIAPYADIRRRVREIVGAVGRFVLVFVDTPLDLCEGRDPKGLYARARAGLIQEFTGISDPYERPDDADIVIQTTETNPVAAAQQILRYVNEHLSAPS